MQLLTKLKEACFSVLPISLLVIALNFTPLVNLSQREMTAFVFSSVVLVIGIGLFTLGADIAMTPMGKYIGSGLTKKRKILLLCAVCFCVGVLITVAEPDLQVLAEQVKSVMNGTVLVLVVGAGVGLFIVVAVLKMISKKQLSVLLMFFYLLLFALTALVEAAGNSKFLPLTFDSGGVTTGPITVPFLMALGIGIANTVSVRDAKENSFGLVALCSVGAVLGVMMLAIFMRGEFNYPVPDYSISENFFGGFLACVWQVTKEVALSLGLLVLFFVVCQFWFLKLPKAKLKQLAVGIALTFAGLVLFLSGAQFAFMPVGYTLGQQLAANGKEVLTIVGFVLGLLVVAAEPAVHVLNKQVEEVTNGQITKRSMLIGLSVGVGISIALSMIRIVYDFSIMWYLVPGYILSLGLSFFVPSIYTAIAFDSGGVASGPLTSSFILPLAIGACMTMQGEAAILQDAFGIVAMVAMTPLITIQFLGFRSVVSKRISNRIALRRISDEDDAQLIEF